MHWFREGSRQRSKILYAFRTPPGVKVGRDAIDPAVIREIEAQHPDIEFDWRALRENQQIIDTSTEPRRPLRRARKDEKEKPAAERPPPAQARLEAAPPAAAPASETPVLPRLVIPPAIEGSTREEQFVFLLNCYLNLRERVPHRTQDPIRREALRALVERLNPEAWVGEEAIVTGLHDAAEALERLSNLFARRRKRPRRAKGDRPQSSALPDPGGSDPREKDTQISDTRGSDPVVPDTQVSEIDSDSSE
jgi:hypothetical protein